MGDISQDQLVYLIEQDYRQGLIGLEEYYRLRRIYGLPAQGERNCPVCGSANLPTAAQCFRCKEPLASAACAPALTLKGIAGPHEGQFLCYQGPVVMGRDSGACNLIIADNADAISRRHAEITYDAANQAFVLRNCSTNGTFVISEGKMLRIDHWTLSPGDHFCLAGPETVYEFTL
jgi:hypothetical protein